jgi:hypothetical protein
MTKSEASERQRLPHALALAILSAIGFGLFLGWLCWSAFLR